MTDVRLIGVSSAISLHDVQGMGTDANQDQFIREVALDLQQKLRDLVADGRPVGDLAFQVTGPHQDPIQGTIWVHTLTGQFDLDTLAPTCEAIRIYRDGADPDGNVTRPTITLSDPTTEEPTRD